VISGEKIFLRGTLPSVEMEGQLVAAIEQIVGPGNAISEYEITPDSDFVPGASSPVYFNEKVLFESGSAVISPDFIPLFAGTPVLLQIQPTVVVTITGHTDSDGSEEANLALSQARVDAVRDWIIDNGGDGDRVIAVGLGESDPIADNSTPEGRQQNRRVEFIIDGFDFIQN
jgi:outer membrane protein OmpA-like peptidoglycan-associated protein